MIWFSIYLQKPAQQDQNQQPIQPTQQQPTQQQQKHGNSGGRNAAAAGRRRSYHTNKWVLMQQS